MLDHFHRPRFSVWLVVSAVATPAFAGGFKVDVEPLINSSCIDCHDADTETGLNFEVLDHDLTNSETFRRWERIFDRLRKGEMPPESESRPDAGQLSKALDSLTKNLRDTSHHAQRENGRGPSRRLTRKEYEYTLHDLLNIHTELADLLPPENKSSSFDTVSQDQGISPLHVRSYWSAAEHALDAAIELGKRPRAAPHHIDYLNSRKIKEWLPGGVFGTLQNGGNTFRLVDDAVAYFWPARQIFKSDDHGFHPKYPGLYRITAEVTAYQAKSPVTFMLVLGSKSGNGARLLDAFDLKPDETRTVEHTAFLNREDYIYPSITDLDCHTDGTTVYESKNGAVDYEGEGIALRWLKVKGPLVKSWPPESTRRLLHGVQFREREETQSDTRRRRRAAKRAAFDIELVEEPMEHVADIVARLAPLAFRRPLKEGEAETFVSLARAAVEQGRDFEEVVRIPLLAILTSPQFLIHAGDPGELDDYALATRLSYFLWKSMPDEELFRLASEEKLSETEVLAQQVERMLDDEKSMRFIHDFLSQWLGLRHIDATTPDKRLYPEYDQVLRLAISLETELFFEELIKNNLSVKNLIDSDFTFVNRRLAEHYGIPGIWGQNYRKVKLPQDSPRGGILTHAIILKVTANGTVTSPVHRGSFVLAKLLGQPPSPPPADVGTIEPDTRGTTTIRETLQAHRDLETCASCHRFIDPPGFALECFDVIGGFRARYRSIGKGDRPKGKLQGRPIHQYVVNRQVDTSGVTADGRPFKGIDDFKEILLEQQEQIARHFISQLVVYATGAEIQFADRQEIDRIVEQTRDNEFPVRTIIHQVVQSQMFRNK